MIAFFLKKTSYIGFPFSSKENSTKIFSSGESKLVIGSDQQEQRLTQRKINSIRVFKTYFFSNKTISKSELNLTLPSLTSTICFE